MGLPWIQVSVDMPSHPKVLALALELGIDRCQAVGHLCVLWTSAGRLAPSGGLSGGHAAQIAEQMAGWSGERGALVAALVSVGLLDEVSDGYQIHDWDEHAGAFVEKFRKDAERKRQMRAARKSSPASAGRPTDVRGTSGGRPQDVQREIEREIETEKKEAIAAVAAPTTDRKSKQQRKPSASEQLVADLEEMRLDELPDSQPTDLKAMKPNLLFAQDKAIGRALTTRGDAVFRRAFAIYLADPYWRPKGSPIRGFLSQWERFVSEADQQEPPLVKLKPGEDPYAMPEPPGARTMTDEEAAARLAAATAKFREQAARDRAEREARQTEVF